MAIVDARAGASGAPPKRPDSGHAVFWLFSRLRDATLIARGGLGLEAGALGVGQRGQVQGAMSLRRGMAGLGAAVNGKMKPLRLRIRVERLNSRLRVQSCVDQSARITGRHRAACGGRLRRGRVQAVQSCRGPRFVGPLSAPCGGGAEARATGGGAAPQRLERSWTEVGPHQLID